MKATKLTVILKALIALLFFGGSVLAEGNRNMRVHMLRLSPGSDPKFELEAFVVKNKIEAAILISAVGSLTQANIRFANQDKPQILSGHYEVVSLSGTLSASSGSHLHISASDDKGKTLGGHLVPGSKVYTTLEVAIGELTDVRFQRVLDPKTTYKELKVIPLKE